MDKLNFMYSYFSRIRLNIFEMTLSISLFGQQVNQVITNSNGPSILSPLLFLVYVNDLPTADSSSNSFLFADDIYTHQLQSTPMCYPI